MPPKILIIEDDWTLRTVYSAYLKKENLDVKISITGKDGLTTANEWQPDLILLDLLMPEMDGIAFLKAFDAHAHPETKVIVFSNLSLPDKVNEAIQLGAVNFKTKVTFTPKEMVALIHDTLDQDKDSPERTMSADTANF